MRMTVGTGLLRCGASPEALAALEGAEAAKGLQDLSATDAAPLQQMMLAPAWRTLSLSELEGCCPSLQTLMAYCRDRELALRQLHVVLVHRATLVGQLAVEAVEGVLHRLEPTLSVERLTDPDLVIHDAERYRNGLANLGEAIVERVEAYRDGHYRVVFNLADGVRALTGFLHVLGAMEADDTIHMLDGAGHVLVTPRLPVRFEPEVFFREAPTLSRRLAYGEEALPVGPEAARALPDVFLYALDDVFTLSEWGSIAWKKARNVLYREQLWPSWHPHLALGADLQSTAQRLSPDRLAQLNERIDDLGRHLASGGAYHPARLDLKPLHGGHSLVPGATHEADAWADRGAKRLFLRREEEGWVVLDLAEGMH